MDDNRQRPLEIRDLEGLAVTYAEANGLNLHGRIAQIKRLLRDAIVAYRDAGNDAEADLISDLFFGKYEDQVTALASELFKAAAKERGVKFDDTEKFKALCETTLVSFAPFLIKFSGGQTESLPRRVKRRKIPTGKIAIGIVAVVAIGTGTATWLTLGHPGSEPGANPGTNGSVVTQGSSSSTNSTPSSPPYAGKTYTEQEGHLGSMVVSDPSSLSEAGQVQPLQKVQVSCKVLNPSMGSVMPNGYWYRLASAPWNNQAYAIANTFLNGDPIVGTSNVPQHYTDFSVPDCPSS